MEVWSAQGHGVRQDWELRNWLHWDACNRRWGGWGSGSFPHLAQPPPEEPGASPSQPAEPAESGYLLPHLSQPGAGQETASLRGHPQPLVCLVHRSRGRVSANFVAAFIKWGFTGALSSLSGLVGELNKTVWDAGAAPEKIFVSQRMEPAFPALCRRGRQGGRQSSWRAGPSEQRSPNPWEPSTVQTGTGPSLEFSSATCHPWAHLEGVASLGDSFLLLIAYLPVPFSSFLPFLLAFGFLLMPCFSSRKLLQRPFAKCCESRHRGAPVLAFTGKSAKPDQEVPKRGSQRPPWLHTGLLNLHPKVLLVALEHVPR